MPPLTVEEIWNTELKCCCFDFRVIITSAAISSICCDLFAPKSVLHQHSTISRSYCQCLCFSAALGSVAAVEGPGTGIASIAWNKKPELRGNWAMGANPSKSRIKCGYKLGENGNSCWVIRVQEIPVPSGAIFLFMILFMTISGFKKNIELVIFNCLAIKL